MECQRFLIYLVTHRAEGTCGMTPSDTFRGTTKSLRNKIKSYKEMAQILRTELSKRPFEWGKYQSVFNYEINGVFREIMNFEKECLLNGDEEKVYKLKRLFTNFIRSEFLHGEYIVWSFQKPYGYAGDFKIIDQIYLNSPKTTGFDRLYDNYFQMSAISVAVRNRKEDFKQIIRRVLSESKKSSIRILDLASGPCRDIWELFSDKAIDSTQAIFDCYDYDERAHTYAKQLINGYLGVNLIKENVVRLALKRDIENAIPYKYDLIYSCGLFDYLDERISVRLIDNLRKLLSNDGRLAVADVRDKYSNPSVHFMEWVGDWSLIYREDDVFRLCFKEAGFREEDLEIGYEQQGIMQYVVASK